MKKIILFFILWTLPNFAHTITTSIAPINDILAQLTKNADRTFYIVGKNQNPHTFALTPKDMKLLSQSDLFVQVGYGFDKWADSLSVKKLNLAQFIDPISPSKNKKTANPHYWLSPKEDIIITRAVFSYLTNQFPENKSVYTKNYKIFLAELQNLDTLYKKNLNSTKPFISSHPVMNYIARDYNLNLADILYKQPGSEPKPKALADIHKKIKQQKIKIFFLKTGFPRNKITKNIPYPLSVYNFDPIGINTDSLIALLNNNLRSLKEGLH